MPIRLAKAARNTRNFGQVVTSKTIPAPVGGWNARDSWADMPANNAITLDNWFPDTSQVFLRNGHSSYATGMTNPVESLMEYASGSTRKFFAAAGAKIYDVTSPGAVGAASVSGLTNARWQHVNFDTSGAHYLIAVNGADAPQAFDGAAWSTPAITGFTKANAIHVNSHHQRLFFIEKNTMNAWYLGTLAIAGAAAQLNFGPYAKMGGSLLAMASWSVDGGSGPRDLAVFITTEGEVIIFEGSDPSDATKWALVGTYVIARPIGRRCFMKIGSDVVVITEDGFIPLSKQLITGRANPKVALSDKISGAIATAARSYGGNFGWQPLLYPRGHYALFNIPTQENAQAQQFVVNTITGAWCRFLGQNASCWGLYDQDLYFGDGSGNVFLADDGSTDNGAAITGDLKTAFNYFGTPSTLKAFTMARPIFVGGMAVTPLMGINVDYEDVAPSSIILSSGSNGSPWDTSLWDVSPWGVTNLVSKKWQATGGIGFCGAAYIRVSTTVSSIGLLAIDYTFQTGGYL